MMIGRKPRVAAIIMAALLCAYAVFGFMGVPRLLRSAARTFVAVHWHRDLALGEVGFNPFTLELDVHDAALPDADGKPLLGFRRLLVNLNLSSVLGRASIE